MDGMWKLCPEAGGPIQFSGFNGNHAVYLLNVYVIKSISTPHFL